MARCANEACLTYTSHHYELKDSTKWRLAGEYWPQIWSRRVSDDGTPTDTHTCMSCYKAKLELQKEGSNIRANRARPVPPIQKHRAAENEVASLRVATNIQFDDEAAQRKAARGIASMKRLALRKAAQGFLIQLSTVRLRRKLNRRLTTLRQQALGCWAPIKKKKAF
jgi:hypothetical protein